MNETKLSPSRSSMSMKLREYVDGYLFIIPAMLIICIFVVYPTLRLVVLSVNEYRFFNGSFVSDFIGLTNYTEAFKDYDFLKSLWQSFYFPLVITPVQTALSLFVAVLIYKNIKGVALFRSIYFIPVVMSFVVVAMFWKEMLNTNFGVINDILGKLGLERQPFLTNPSLARLSICIVSIWKSWGWYFVIFTAALIQIPPELYESSNIDGATPLQNFWYITLPSLRRTMLFVMIMSTTNCIKLFTPIMIMTDGGPVKSTEVIVHYIWLKAFRENQYGYASALSIILFLILLVITRLQYAALKDDE